MAKQEPTTAVHYLQIPATLEIPPRCGWNTPVPGKPQESRDGGPLEFSEFFMKFMLGAIADWCKANDKDELEVYLLSLFRRCTPLQKIEITHEALELMKQTVPTWWAQKAPDLFAEAHPYFTAIRRAPIVKPADWDGPSQEAPAATN